ncbi:hypothetical protein ACWCP6_04650 [Streptomyces sp. NPDC002004]
MTETPQAPPGVGALLAAAVRPDGISPDAEQRAVAAFLAARDSGAHGARTRRRDDWRPRARRWAARWPLRATLGTVLAGLTLGGVAMATIGTRGDGGDNDARQARPAQTASAPEWPSGRRGWSGASGRPAAPGGTASASAAPDGEALPSPSAAHPRAGRGAGAGKDDAARCRAYDSADAHGHKPNSTAWQRLVRAAGGEQYVPGFCAGVTARESARGVDPDGADPSVPGSGTPTPTPTPDESTTHVPDTGPGTAARAD